MRKWAIRIVVFAVIGAVVNVLVAWGGSYIEETDLRRYDAALAGAEASFQNDSKILGFEHVSIEVRDGMTVTEVKSKRFRDSVEGGIRTPFTANIDEITPMLIVPSWAGALETPMDDYAQMRTNFEWRTVIGRGFPWRAVWCEQSMSTKKYTGAWVVDLSPGEWVLPYTPTWPGFVLGTLLYGCAAYYVVFGWKAIRRRTRLAHGQCGQCGHELMKSGVRHERCPECGEATIK